MDIVSESVLQTEKRNKKRREEMRSLRHQPQCSPLKLDKTHQHNITIGGKQSNQGEPKKRSRETAGRASKKCAPPQSLKKEN